jgi:YHS domain-containing protein
MKNIFLAVSVGFIMVSCNQNTDNTSTAPVPEMDSKKLDISMLSSNIDPVCEMELTNEMLADTAIVDGKVIGFCNVGCKEEFKKKH